MKIKLKNKESKKIMELKKRRRSERTENGRTKNLDKKWI